MRILKISIAKYTKIIEVKKGITLNIKRDIRKIELDERG